MFDCAGMQKICGRIVRPLAQNRPSRPPGRDPTSAAIAALPPPSRNSALRRLAAARAHIIGATLVKFDTRKADPGFTYMDDYYGYSAEDEEVAAATLIATRKAG